MTTWQRFKQTVDNWISHPNQRPYVGSVQAQPGDKTVAIGKTFAPEASYFSVRLVEMGLAEGGKFFTSFLPLGVCLTEYTVGDERQRRPLVLSNDLIAGQLKDSGTKPGYIEYTNMYAVRCAPVKADNLSLFVGLFRMPYDDLAKQVLQIASDLTHQVGGEGNPATAAVGAGMRIAEKVYDGVSGLFGLKGITPLFGFADGSALVDSRYLLVSGPPANAIDSKRLLVVDNQLHLDGKRATGFDYCLVAIEHTASRLPQGADTINPLTGLAFHRRWREIGQLLAAKNVGEAEARLAQLRAEVIVSPELTEDDRLIAIAAYDTGFEKLRRVLIPVNSGSTSRGDRGTTSSASLLSTEARQRTKAGQQITGDVLSQMATRLLLTSDTTTNNDPIQAAEAVFATEAIALRKGLGRIDHRGKAHVAAAVAEAISGAVGRHG
ncbi:hypothetical protein [Reyranella sp.]|uniref:hypothetical protein n=1 Tax=Reyranella sp. TaxID=1929291 RepID=UPI003D0D417E